ncbi:MAG: hypothetical protein C5B49_06295 [Bdellovibrio sp.]|nr:MAG: hypothetical protein C5B49_06295 [Bdellovibrio sp.]
MASEGLGMVRNGPDSILDIHPKRIPNIPLHLMDFQPIDLLIFDRIKTREIVVDSMSLSRRFALLGLLYTCIVVSVLYLMIAAKNEPIDFGSLEMVGNIYQRPVEKVLRGVVQHRILAQRVLYNDKDSRGPLEETQKSIDAAIGELEKIDRQVGETLQFTEKGLHSRKRDDFKFANVQKEWTELKGKVLSLKPGESNDQHAHLIGLLRGMITHLGDTSNLILDPDLDSYYLMDVTLLALPQTQDRIQSVVVDLEPIVRRQSVTTEDRIKASVFVSMMNEADYERIKGDFTTVLNEDPNFYGKLETLESKLSPKNQQFLASYKEFIDVANAVASGNAVPVDKFLQTSNRALSESFDYWDSADEELDKLLTKRIEFYQTSKLKGATMSVALTLFALGILALFNRYVVRNMREIVSVLNQSSQQVSNASLQSAKSATKLTEASTEQAASLQETMASIEEISAMVRQNADSASRTRDAVIANQSLADSGSAIVREMITAIHEIKSTNEEILKQMEESTKEFGAVVKIISEIGSKTNVINEIVFQTKLLSFNASVEAARAGEHGKGFAVVAEEVGNLAQMSGNAAKEITDMLTGSIKNVNEIVERTKVRVERLVVVGRGKIALGQETAQKCNDTLEKVTENGRTVSSMVSDIASASKEQSQGIQEINQAVIQLDQVTQQNASVAHESSSQADQLRAEAQVLSSAVHQLVSFVDGVRKRVAGIGAPQQERQEQLENNEVMAMKAMKMKTVKSMKGAKAPKGQKATGLNHMDEPKETKEKAVEKAGANVLPFKRSKSNQHSLHASEPNPVKEVVGGEMPSSDDPRFEQV